MFNENRFIYIEIVPPYSRRHGRGGFEAYRPKEFSKTLPGKLEKIDREIRQQEAQRVLEKLSEIRELECPKCKSKLIDEDNSDPKMYKLKCLDCGFKWEIKR